MLNEMFSIIGLLVTSFVIIGCLGVLAIQYIVAVRTEAEAKRATEWYDATEFLPNAGEQVLIIHPQLSVVVAGRFDYVEDSLRPYRWYYHTRHGYTTEIASAVRWWMYLPEVKANDYGTK